MQKESKVQLTQMMSLMERMDKHYTNDQAKMLTENKLREKKLLEEAKRVSYPNLEAFFLKHRIPEGSFAKIGYIQLYPVTALYPNDELHTKMRAMRGGYEDGTRGSQHFDQFMDQSQNSEWNNPEGRAYNGIRSFKNKLYPYILKLTTYQVNWQARKGYANAFSKQSELDRDIKSRVPQGLEDKYYPNRYADETPEERAERLKKRKYYRFADDWLGDAGVSQFMSGDEEHPEELKFHYLSDVNDPNSQVEYNKTAIRNILNGNVTNRQKPQYFGVYEDGSIDMIPKDLGRLLQGKSKLNIEKLVDITDEEEKKWAEEFFNNLDTQSLTNKTFLLTNIAYLAATPIGEEAIYWRNEHPLFLLEKTINKEKVSYKFNVNEQELADVLERFARNSAEELSGIENPNI